MELFYNRSKCENDIRTIGRGASDSESEECVSLRQVLWKCKIFIILLIYRDIFTSACVKRDSEENVNVNVTSNEAKTSKTTTESSSAEKSYSDDEETPKDVDFENVFFSKFSSFNASTRAMLGHKMIDMIRFCTFKGKTCNL